MKRIIALLIAVAAMCVLLVACGSDKTEDKTKAVGAVIPTDAAGETVYATDAEGYPVYPTDEQGEVVYATDAQGEPIVALDTEGTPITGNGGSVTDSGSKPATAATSAEPTAAEPTSAPTQADSTSADEPTAEPTEEEIPVVIATLPEQDPYELPILP